MTQLRHSPLHERHLSLGAKMADFGGWEMPIEYPAGGVLAEHAAVRDAVGIFDVSHLGKIDISGPGALDFINACLTNDLRKIAPGQAQYTLCCDDATGGVVDDLIAYLHGDDHVLLVPNAANSTEVARRLIAAAPPGLTITNLHSELAVLAVQGPKSGELMAAVGLPTELGYMSFEIATHAGGEAGLPVIVCRTGYTGEKGFELLVPAQIASAVWGELLMAGSELGVMPCGLGARDTLRTEMGYPLHGHELSLEITPLQARTGWAVGWDKPAFWGRDVLLAERAAGAPRLLRGLNGVERGIARLGMLVLDAPGGRAIGTVTSGTFSPTLRHPIALALLARDVAVGTQVVVDVRGRAAGFTVVNPPFVAASTKD